MIEEGKTYLFAVRSSIDDEQHTLVPVYGHDEISNDEEKRALINRFSKAFQEQIEFTSDWLKKDS